MHGAQKTCTVARIKWFYVACSETRFLSLDTDMFGEGRYKFSNAATASQQCSNLAV
jgi:hypothetical protein